MIKIQHSFGLGTRDEVVLVTNGDDKFEAPAPALGIFLRSRNDEYFLN